MTEKKKSHVEQVLDVVRSGYSPLGDKTWTTETLVRETGLTDRQVYNAISKIGQFARMRGEKPIMFAVPDVRGVYTYVGPLKRGRKKSNGVHAESPTEQVPFTEAPTGIRDEDLKNINIVALEDEGQVVAANEAAAPKTFVEGFAKIGEQMQVAMGGIAGALGLDEAMKSAVEAEKAAVTLQSKALRNNRVSRVRRLMKELADEMLYLQNEWDALTEKGRRYDKLTMTMFGFSSNDPTAVDGLGGGVGES